MSTKQSYQNKSIEFATHKTVLSPEDRYKAKRNLPKKVGLVALSGLTVFAAYNKLEKAAKVEPSAISSILSSSDYNKLSSDGLPVLTDVVIKPSQTIHFRSSCNFESSDGTPLNNIVFELNPGTGNKANESIRLASVIPVTGPPADTNISLNDTWFVVPTGHGDQAVCFDASEASRGSAYADVLTSSGESAVGSNPNATAVLKDNNIYVNSSQISPLQYSQS